MNLDEDSDLARRAWARAAQRRRVRDRLRGKMRALPAILAEIRWARVAGLLPAM